MLSLQLLQILLLGFLCGMIPGPVITTLFTQVNRKGWKPARRIVWLGALGELILSITCVSGFSLLAPDSVVFPALKLFGALLLISLCFDLWRTEEIHEKEPLFSNDRVILIALTSAVAWLFWITVCTPLAVELGREISGGKWIFVALFEAGWIAATMLLCYFFDFFRAFFQNNRKMHLLYRAVALAFLGFAVKLAIASGHALLQ